MGASRFYNAVLFFCCCCLFLFLLSKALFCFISFTIIVLFFVFVFGQFSFYSRIQTLAKSNTYKIIFYIVFLYFFSYFFCLLICVFFTFSFFFFIFFYFLFSKTRCYRIRRWKTEFNRNTQRFVRLGHKWVNSSFWFRAPTKTEFGLGFFLFPLLSLPLLQKIYCW